MSVVLWIKAALMGIVEGLTEFLPISSTGHLILANSLLGFGQDFGAEKAQVFEIAIQTGAILAVMLVYAQRIRDTIGGLATQPQAQRFTINVLVGFLPAVVLGLVYSYTPFVILAIYSALQRLDPSYAEASRDLGASAATTFLRITLPLTAPGVAAGAVFVFVLSIGNFVTPDLLGGGKFQMAGNLIYDQFLSARDWPFGATLSAVLIAVMMALLFLQALGTARARGEHGRA